MSEEIKQEAVGTEYDASQIQVLEGLEAVRKRPGMDRFGLDDIQAQVVLDMRLKALQGLEREKLENEYKELQERIAYYESLLADEGKLRQVLKEELTALRDRYGDDRLTEIQDVEDEIDSEDLIEEEQCVFTMSHAGYIKRVPASTYRSQKRGGKGVTGMRRTSCLKSAFLSDDNPLQSGPTEIAGEK